MSDRQSSPQIVPLAVDEPWFMYRSTSPSKFDVAQEHPSGEECSNTEILSLYERFKINHRQFRLLKLLPSQGYDQPIVCEFVVQDLGSAPAYTALSYSWRSTSKSHITVSDCQFLVSSRVSAAMRRLRYSDRPVLIWIDAVCIHQKDDTEKSHQVRAMNHIYRNADEVVIWLGNYPDDMCGAVFVLLEAFARAATCPHSEGESCTDCTTNIAARLQDRFPYPEAWQNLDMIFYDEWWNRTWVVQELLLARRAWILMGPALLRWEAFEMAMDFLLKIHRRAAVLNMPFGPNKQLSLDTDAACTANDGEASEKGLESHEAAPEPNITVKLQSKIHKMFGQLYNPWLTSGRRRFQVDGGFEMLELLVDMWKRDATQPLDKIFAIQHLIKDELPATLLPDYSRSASSVYKEVVRHLISRDRTLDVLLCAYRNMSSRVALPTWCPTWDLRLYLSHTPWYTEVKGPALAPTEEQHLQSRVQFVKKARSEYAASGSSVAEAKFTDNLGILTLRGVRLDSVELAQCHDPHNKATLEEFMYSLLAEMVSAGIITNLTDTYVYGGSFVRAVRKLLIPGVLDIDDITTRAEAFDQAVENMHGKILFVTKSKLLGYAFGEVKKGDIVCLLYGGKTPFILRPLPLSREKGEAYEFVCGCYIEGVMTGVLMDPADTSKLVRSLEEREFTIA